MIGGGGGREKERKSGLGPEFLMELCNDRFLFTISSWRLEVGELGD